MVINRLTIVVYPGSPGLSNTFSGSPNTVVGWKAKKRPRGWAGAPRGLRGGRKPRAGNPPEDQIATGPQRGGSAGQQDVDRRR